MELLLHILHLFLYVSQENLTRFGANVKAKFATKQNVISDLSEIRSNASTGAGLADKVEGLESGAQVNVIETVKVNGTALTVSSKEVDVTVPTQLSDIATTAQQNAADSGITSAKVSSYDALVSATTISDYGITDAYTKTEIDAKLTSAMHYKGTVANYAALPAEPETGDVYNVTAADSEHGIKAGDNVAWNGSAWDVLSGVVDLSAYTTTSEFVPMTNDEVDALL